MPQGQVQAWLLEWGSDPEGQEEVKTDSKRTRHWQASQASIRTYKDVFSGCIKAYTGTVYRNKVNEFPILLYCEI